MEGKMVDITSGGSAGFYLNSSFSSSVPLITAHGNFLFQ